MLDVGGRVRRTNSQKTLKHPPEWNQDVLFYNVDLTKPAKITIMDTGKQASDDGALGVGTFTLIDTNIVRAHALGAPSRIKVPLTPSGFVDIDILIDGEIPPSALDAIRSNPTSASGSPKPSPVHHPQTSGVSLKSGGNVDTELKKLKLENAVLRSEVEKHDENIEAREREITQRLRQEFDVAFENLRAEMEAKRIQPPHRPTSTATTSKIHSELAEKVKENENIRRQLEEQYAKTALYSENVNKLKREMEILRREHRVAVAAPTTSTAAQYHQAAKLQIAEKDVRNNISSHHYEPVCCPCLPCSCRCHGAASGGRLTNSSNNELCVIPSFNEERSPRGDSSRVLIQWVRQKPDMFSERRHTISAGYNSQRGNIVKRNASPAFNIPAPLSTRSTHSWK
jgi:hypothetical protein